jgi:hypothetical protein
VGKGVAYSQPDGDVRVSWETSATLVLLITERLDDDWVFHRAYIIPLAC